MAEGCWHGLVTETELRAVVKVINPPPSLPVAPVAVVPASQMLRHHGLMHVLGQKFIPGAFSVSRRSHRCIGILGESIRTVAAVVSESVVSVEPIHLVGRVDVVVAFHFILIHISTVGVMIHVGAGVVVDVVGTWSVVGRVLT